MESWRRLVPGIIILLLLLLAAPSFAARGAEEPRQLDAAVQGEVIDAPGTADRAEVVRFGGGGLTLELLGTALEQSVRIAGWPVAPGERADVVLTRHDVYASDAKIWRIEGQRETEVPRSRLAFFWGTAEGDDDMRVFAAVDPDTDQLDGFAVSQRGAHEIHPLTNAKLGTAAILGARRYLLAPPETFLEQATPATRTDPSVDRRSAPPYSATSPRPAPAESPREPTRFSSTSRP